MVTLALQLAVELVAADAEPPETGIVAQPGNRRGIGATKAGQPRPARTMVRATIRSA